MVERSKSLLLMLAATAALTTTACQKDDSSSGGADAGAGGEAQGGTPGTGGDPGTGGNPTGGTRQTRLDVLLDNSGHYASGVPGPDFSVTGKVTIDGKPKEMQGQVVCTNAGGSLSIAIGEATTGIAVMMAPDASKVNSVGLGNVDGVSVRELFCVCLDVHLCV